MTTVLDDPGGIPADDLAGILAKVHYLESGDLWVPEFTYGGLLVRLRQGDDGRQLLITHIATLPAAKSSG